MMDDDKPLSSPIRLADRRKQRPSWVNELTGDVPTLHDLRYSYQGEEFRVIVAGDVIALPYERWSLGHFGQGIDIVWLLAEAQLPGRSKARRQLLAELVRTALAHAHGYTVTDCRPFQPVQR